MTAETLTLSINGVDYCVDRAGDGPPVVLLHGFTGSRRSWAGLANVLAGSYTTYVIDHLGHGQTDAPEDPARYAMDRAVDDLVDLLHALGHERAIWLGYSLGGRTALQVTVRHPEAVSALILEGASAGLETGREREERVAADERLARMIEVEGLERFVDFWGGISLWASQQHTLTEAQRAALRAGRMQQRGVGLANSLRGMGTGAQTWLGDRLGEVRVPVLLTAGRLDTKYAEIATQMASAMPNATVRLIEDAGHAAHLEQPEAFNAVVLEFLRTVTG